MVCHASCPASRVIMVLEASWALSDLGKQRLTFAGGRDVPVSESLLPRSGFVWDSGMAGPRLCQLLEVLRLPAFQVKVVYHPTNLATLGDDLLRLLCLLFCTKPQVTCQCVCVCGGGGGDGEEPAQPAEINEHFALLCGFGYRIQKLE